MFKKTVAEDLDCIGFAVAQALKDLSKTEIR
jgi:hypothetical protein